MRVLLLVVALNTALFTAGLYFLTQEAERSQKEYAEVYLNAFVRALGTTVTPQSDLSVLPILRWEIWEKFPDAIVVRAAWEEGPGGEIQPSAAWLNPRGRFLRPVDFDEQAVLASLAQTMRTRSSGVVGGGLTVPIEDSQGAIWGATWMGLAGTGTNNLGARLLPWFLFSLLLLTLGTFFVLRRSILDPLDALAGGARRVTAGDLSVRLPEPGRADEIGQLIRGFNEMTANVQGFNARLEREVEQATGQARRAEAAALTQRRLAAMGELAAGIAHEINNPLGGLLNAVESLERGKLPPEKHARYFELLRSGLERIQATVGRLLRFTPRAAPVGPVSLARALEDALELVQHRARALGVELALSAGKTGEARERVLERWRALPPLEGERGELAQAVLNLLVNALDALEDDGRPGGRIEITLVLEQGELALVVRDDGPGVRPENLPRVADLFFTTKEVGKGTGLGLSIVHQVVAAHGGRVYLANAPGGGFQVEIRLPLRAEQRA